MNKTLKLLLIIGCSLIFLGGIVFVVCLAASGWNFRSFSNVQVEYKTFEEKTDNEITSLSIDYNVANVVVYVSADTETLSVKYPQMQNKKGENIAQITVQETQNTLSIKETALNTSFNIFNFESSNVSVYLPQNRVYALNLQSETGSITLQGTSLQTSSILLETATGMVSSKNCTISCTGEAHLETTTGMVSVGELSAQSIVLETTTGYVKVHNSITAQTSVSLKSNTGRVETLGVITANSVSMETNTGDVKATGEIRASSITLETTTGDVKAAVGGKKDDFTIIVSYDTGDSNLHSQTGGAKTLNVSTDTGDIYVTFTE